MQTFLFAAFTFVIIVFVVTCAGGGGRGRRGGTERFGVTRSIVFSGSLFFVVVLGGLAGGLCFIVFCLVSLFLLLRRAVALRRDVGLRGSSSWWEGGSVAFCFFVFLFLCFFAFGRWFRFLLVAVNERKKFFHRPRVLK